MRAEPDEHVLIGVTGNIACGKSLVTSELERLGATVIDADTVYHELIEPGEQLWSRLLQHFGKGIATPGGRIDRKALGAIVFADPAKLRELESMTHPVIRAEVLQRVHDAPTKVVAVSAVKLIEGGWDEICDSIWIVTCPEEEQRRRLMEKRGMSAADVEARLAAQPPVEPKLAIADVVIDNSGTVEATRAAVEHALNELLARNPR
ncbi:MAG: dephospho-CoA kinase [Thermomicrobiales bacterium]|nr:dephospho-CoA kinase [Thermomicrobiales bacterium]